MALTAAIGMLASACGGGGSSSDGSSVTLWMYPVIADQTASQEYWSQVEQDFEADNAGIDLNIELQPWDGRLEKVSTALSTETGPDIVLLLPEQIHQFVEEGTLIPVDDLLGEGTEVFNPNPIESVTIDGSVYAAPIYQQALTTVYNTKILEEVGVEPPTTWDEVMAAAPKLVDAGYTVFDYAGSPEETKNITFYPLLWQAGGQVFNDAGTEVVVDSPEGVRALEFLLDLQEMGALPPDVATKLNDVQSGPLVEGMAAMGYNLDLSQTRLVAEAIGEENVEVGLPLQDAEQITYGTPGLLAVSHKVGDEAKDSVGKVLTHLASAEVQTSLADASGFYPARSDASMTDPDRLATAFGEAVPLASAGQPHQLAPQVNTILGPHIQAALLGKVSAKEALTAAAEEANQMLETSS